MIDIIHLLTIFSGFNTGQFFIIALVLFVLVFLLYILIRNFRRRGDMPKPPPPLLSKISTKEAIELFTRGAKDGKKTASGKECMFESVKLNMGDVSAKDTFISLFIYEDLNNFASLRDSRLANRIVSVDCRSSIIGKMLVHCNENRDKCQTQSDSCKHCLNHFSRWLVKIDETIAKIESSTQSHIPKETRSEYIRLENLPYEKMSYELKRTVDNKKLKIRTDIETGVKSQCELLIALLKLKETLINNMKPFFESYLRHHKKRIDFYWRQARKYSKTLPIIPPTENMEGLLLYFGHTVLGSYGKMLNEVSEKISETESTKNTFKADSVLRQEDNNVDYK